MHLHQRYIHLRSSWHPAAGRYHSAVHELSSSTEIVSVRLDNSQPCYQNTDEAWRTDPLLIILWNKSADLSPVSPVTTSPVFQ